MSDPFANSLLFASRMALFQHLLQRFNIVTLIDCTVSFCNILFNLYTTATRLVLLAFSLVLLSLSFLFGRLISLLLPLIESCFLLHLSFLFHGQSLMFLQFLGPLKKFTGIFQGKINNETSLASQLHIVEVSHNIQGNFRV